MKYQCPACKKILVRRKDDKAFITKSGFYRGYCEKKGKNVLLKPIKKGEK
jgi:uncharacterized C2H2 Zn-finger protein